MGWSFTADSDNQLAVKTNLDQAATEFDSEVTTVYGQVNSLSAYWEGSDYDTFKTNAEGYKTALADLANTMRAFGVHFKSVSDGTIALANECSAIILDLFNHAGAGAAGPAAPGGAGGPGGGANQVNPNGGGNPADPNANPNGGGNPADPNANPNGGGNPADPNANPNGGGNPADPNANPNGGGNPADPNANPNGGGNPVDPNANPDGGSTADNRPQFSTGDPVKINGEDYHVYGYVTGSDGKSVAIYEGTDGYLYSFDASGNKQNVVVKETFIPSEGIPMDMSENAKGDSVAGSRGFGYVCLTNGIVVNGVEYKLSEIAGSGYSAEGVQANPSGTHSSYDRIDPNTRVSETSYTGMSGLNDGAQTNLASHNGANNQLAVPGNLNAVRNAVKNQQPIKILAGHSLKVDTGWFGSSRTVGDDSKDVYLVYHNGKYYVADENGNIGSYSDPINPDNILNGSGISNDTEFK